jgi:hypothetical protein
MKILIAIGFCSAFVGQALAQTNKLSTAPTNAPAKSHTIVVTNQVQPIIVSAPKTVTIIGNDGTVYNVMGIYLVEPDGITVKNLVKGGMGYIGATKIPFENLPVEIQKKFNYDSQKAAAYQGKIKEQKKIEYEIAKDRYEERIELERLQAEQRIANASEVQAIQQERTAQALEEQNYHQQLQAIEQDIQAQQTQEKLDDIDWDLRFRSFQH